MAVKFPFNRSATECFKSTDGQCEMQMIKNETANNFERCDNDRMADNE